MRSKTEQKDLDELSSFKELQVLTELEASSEITQRKLSQRVAISLGLTNALIRSLISKGYIRSQQASWKRWVYAITPEGLTHKIRLVVAYIRRFMDDYQKVRRILREQLEPLSLHEESRVAIFGTGEFAELVYLGIKELGIDEIDIFSDDPAAMSRFLGMPVRDFNSILTRDYDRILFARLNRTPNEDLVRMLAEEGEPEKLVTFFLESPSREQA